MKRSAYKILFVSCVIVAALFIGKFCLKFRHENRILNEVIARLEAESRIAEVLVTGVNYDDETGELLTTIKFLEYDAKGRPLEPKYFTFPGNIIQFQSLVIRFDDIEIRRADRLRGKSAYLFWKIFMLDGGNTKEYDIAEIYGVPDGYKLETTPSNFEENLWERFWKYALDPKEAYKMRIKNAQIEAPGTMFIPGMLYTLKIEHDAGIRIDASPLPHILKGEHIPQ